MDNNDGFVELKKRKRLPVGSKTRNISVNVAEYLLAVIDEEAAIKGKTRSNVIGYLLLAGLKAHIGRFVVPGNNTIKENYKKRGNKW
jgi:hypothetical protein